MKKYFVLAMICFLGFALISCEADEAIYPVQKDGNISYIDRDGNIVLENQKHYRNNVNKDEVFYVKKENSVEYYNSEGKLFFSIDPFCEKTVKDFKCGLLQHKDVESELWGYLDKAGNWKIQPIYDDINDFSDDVAWVKKNGLFSLIDINGNIIFTLDENICAVDSFYNGYAYIVKKVMPDFYVPDEDFPGASESILGTLGGIIDKKGNMVIPFSLRTNTKFSEGLFCTRDCKLVYGERPTETLYGYKNLNNEWVIEPKYSSAENFYMDTAVVSEDGINYGVIDKVGNEIISQKYKFIMQALKNDFIVSKDMEQFYLIDKTENRKSESFYYQNFMDQYMILISKTKNDNRNDFGYLNYEGKIFWFSDYF